MVGNQATPGSLPWPDGRIQLRFRSSIYHYRPSGNAGAHRSARVYADRCADPSFLADASMGGCSHRRFRPNLVGDVFLTRPERMRLSFIRGAIAANDRSLFAYELGLSRFPRRAHDGFARTLFPAAPQFLHAIDDSADRKHLSRPRSPSRLAASGEPWVSPAVYRCWSERTCGLARMVSQGTVGLVCHRIQRLCDLAVYSTRVIDHGPNPYEECQR